MLFCLGGYKCGFGLIHIKNTLIIIILTGLFDYKHMAFVLDEDRTNPSLAEMTETAIKILQKNPNGFYLFVEG